jgi:hypothetical protein
LSAGAGNFAITSFIILSTTRLTDVPVYPQTAAAEGCDDESSTEFAAMDIQHRTNNGDVPLLRWFFPSRRREFPRVCDRPQQ